MVARSILTTGCLLALACSASEDANDAVRCAPDLSCPQQHVCYRGFCVERPAQSEDASTPPSVPDVPVSPNREPTVTAVDASSAPSAVATDAGSATPNERPAPATVPTTGSVGTLTGGSASEPVAPANPQPASPPGPPLTSPPPASTDAGGGSVLPASPPPSSSSALPEHPVASSPVEACLQACTLSSKDDKACEHCFEALYGGKPNKLCSGSEKAETKVDASTLVVCAAFCAVAPEGPFGCKDAGDCHGAACGSD